MNSDQTDLLFGMLVRQQGSVRPADFIDALRRWSGEESATLGDVLLRMRLISEADYRDAEETYRKMLRQYSGNVGGIAFSLFYQALSRTDRKHMGKLLDAISSDSPVTSGESDDRQLGARYTLREMYAEGGLGEVWLAWDRDLERTVAVKKIRVSLANQEEIRERFLREARITAQLQHPTIVPVHDLGWRSDADGPIPYYAMRFVQGRTMQELILEYHDASDRRRADPLLFDRLLSAFVQVCQAIDFAHGQGTLHRDLKPANVVLGEHGEVVLLDWGLAKSAGTAEDANADDGNLDGPADSVDRTRAGKILGTPGFMAPEQAAGRTDALDERTDIYGLGAILFAILTGREPHRPRGGDTVQQALDHIILQPAPSPRSVRAHVPRPLDAICAKAMARDPNRRYQQAGELTNEVRLWQAGQPVDAYSERWPQRLARRFNQRPALAGFCLAGLLSVVVLAASTGAMFWTGARELTELRVEGLKLNVQDMGSYLVFEIQRLRTDALFLSGLPGVELMTEAPKPDARLTAEQRRQLVLKIFRKFLNTTPTYTAIRLLDPKAPDSVLVGVDRSDGRISEADSSYRSKHDAEEAKAMAKRLADATTSKLPPLWLTDTPDEGPRMHSMAPVSMDGVAEVAALVVVTLDLGRLWTEQTAVNLTPDQESYLTDPTGTVLMPPDAADAGANNKIQSTFPELAPLFAQQGGSDVVTVRRSRQDKQAIHGRRFRYDPDRPDHFLTVDLTSSHLATAFRENTPLEHAVLAAALSSALALVVAVLLVQWIVRQGRQNYTRP